MQAGGVLDLGLDAYAAGLELVRQLDLGQQLVGHLDVAGRADLRQHHRVELLAGLLDDVDQVAVVVRRVGAVDAHDHGRGAEVVLAQGSDDEPARVGLLGLGDRVLEVEEHLVGVEPRGLREEALARARDGVTAAAGAHRAGNPTGVATLPAPVRAVLLATLMLLLAAPAAEAAVTVAMTLTPVETTLDKTTKITGTALLDGAPFGGQPVQLEGRRYPFEDEYEVLATGTTAADGTYAFERELDRNWDLRVRAGDGVSPHQRAYVFPATVPSYRARSERVVRLTLRYRVPRDVRLDKPTIFYLGSRRAKAVGASRPASSCASAPAATARARSCGCRPGGRAASNMRRASATRAGAGWATPRRLSADTSWMGLPPGRCRTLPKRRSPSDGPGNVPAQLVRGGQLRVLAGQHLREVDHHAALLPGRVVLHLAVDHVDAAAVRDRLDDLLGEGHLVGVGGEDLARDVELRGVQRPGADAAHQVGGAELGLAALDVADVAERAVEGEDAGAGAGVDHAAERVVPEVLLGGRPLAVGVGEHDVAGVAAAHARGLHPSRRGEVGGAEAHALHARGGGGDLLDVGDAERGLEDRVDEDRSLQLGAGLELGEQAIDVVDVLRALDLGDHHDVDPVADLGHDLREVVEHPRAFQRVDPGPQLRLAELDRPADLDQPVARGLLAVDRDRVLEVAEQDVGLGRDVGRLADHLLVGEVEEVDHPAGPDGDLPERFGGADGERCQEGTGVAHGRRIVESPGL